MPLGAGNTSGNGAVADEELRRARLLTVQRSDDPFFHPPGIPENWGLLRSVLQIIVGLALISGPSVLLNEVVEPLWDNVPWSFVTTFGLPVLIAAAGIGVRRRISRTAGSLVIAGAAIHFIGWLLVVFYAIWLTRSL